MFPSTLRRALLMAVAIAAAAPALTAQQGGVVTGQVLDAATRAPVPAAQIQIVGTQRGGVTGEDGRFRIANVVPGTYRIRALRIGYTAGSQMVTIGAGATATVAFALRAAAVSLDQVVTTATGQKESRRQQGSNVAVVQPRQSDLATASTPSQLLTGKIAGVDVSTSGGTIGAGTRIRIRGANSISLSNEPIIIVDGVRMNNAVGNNTVSGATTLGVGGQTPSPFNYINPEDIASIEVLKGPAAAALYGTAAASGVIQITTKHGRNAKPRWTAFGEAGSIRDVTNYPANYARIGTTAAGKRTTSCTLNNQALKLCTPFADSLVSYNPLVQHSPFINGWRGAYGLSVQGGTDAVNYYLGGDFDREQGVFTTSQDQRASGRANLSAQLRDNWNVTVGTNYLTDHLQLPQNDNNILGIVSGGLLGSAFGATDKVNFGYLAQAPEYIAAINTRQDVQRFENSINTSYQPLSWLSANAIVGLDYFNRYDNEVIPPNRVSFGSLPQGQRTSNPYQIFNYTANGSVAATWSPFGSLRTTTTAGVQFNKEMVRGTRAFGAQLLAGTASLSGTTSRFSVGETNTDNKTLGLLVREELAWGDRLFLSGALRNDKNSAFGQNFGSVTYPSAQLSWVVSDESFFPKQGIVNLFRLRAADGRSGRQPQFRDAITYYSAQTVTVGGTDVPGIVVGGNGNPNLRPEISTEGEGGADIGLFNQRIGIELTYYHKVTNDLLVAVPLAPSLGLTSSNTTSSQFRNLGSAKNTGWEYSVNARVFDTRPASFDVTFTGSTNNNSLITLGKLPTGKDVPPILLGNQQIRAGYPLGGYWLRPITFKDANGDGIISRNEVTVGDTNVYMGSPFASREYSVTPALSLFGFLRIAAQFDHKGGFKVFNNTARFRCAFGNCSAAYLPSTPLAEQAAAVAIPLGSDAGYIENGDFTKLRELSFTITAPQRLAQAFRARDLNVVIAGRNLHTWTNYTGFDPEVNSTPGLNFSTSDFLTLPPSRVWTARVNVTF